MRPSSHIRLPLILLMLCPLFTSAEGKLLATPGVTQFEGSGGGGLVPWATMAGYDSRDETASQVFATRLNLDDFELLAYGVAFSFKDQVEISVARQELEVEPLGVTIRQNVVGAKIRLYGDLVYSKFPQVSAGVQYKRLLDEAVPLAVGASRTRGTDIYLAASKLHLGAVGGYNLLWGLTLRYTNANQTGFLGFGGDQSDARSLQAEGSIAVLFSRQLALGVEYRHKPDNLSFAREESWKDVFIAWIPNKQFNVTVAYADLGDVAGLTDQEGIYVSVTGYMH